MAVRSKKTKEVSMNIEATKKAENVLQEIKPVADLYSKEMLTEFNKRSRIIKQELGKVETSFSKIAFNLHWIYKNEAFKELGYKDVYSFAKSEFSIARGTCSNFINVVERFGKRIDGVVTDQIDDSYKKFKSSQLVLMLGVSYDDIKNFDENMSVRDMKKAIKGTSTDSKPSSKKASSGSDSESEQEETYVESKEINRQPLITISTMEEWDSQEDKIYDMVKRALKDPKHRVVVSYEW